MNTMLKVVGFTGLLGLSSAASALNVGGVVWNPNDPIDFSMQFNFTQWYTSSADAIGSGVNLAPNYAAAQNVPAGLTNGDSTLTGVGEVYSLNGTAVATFCPGCELTTVFGGILLTDIATQSYDYTNAFVNIYVDTIPPGDYPWPADASSQADADAAADGNLWLSLSLNTFSLTGVVNNGFVNSLQTITGGMAAPWFVPDSQEIPPNSGIFYDAQYGGSAFFTAAQPFYSQSGNGQFLADTVPEPGSLALLGLGVLGFCASAMRRKAVA